MSALAAGKTAPAFELKDLDGKTHSLAELCDADLALLVFYHSECPVCQFSMPFVAAMAQAAASRRIKVCGISQDPEDESVEFATRKGLRIPILIDEPPYPVSNAYGITNVPTLFLIGRDGKIVCNCVGFAKADFIEVAAALAKAAGVKAPDVFAGRSDIPALRPG